MSTACESGKGPLASHRSVAARYDDWLSTLRSWRHRIQTRRQLLELDDRLLQDIGLRRGDALHEARKPFWQP